MLWRVSLPFVCFAMFGSCTRASLPGAEPKDNMRWIIGNGHSGKMQELEERVDRNEAYSARFTGIATPIASMVTLFIWLLIGCG